MLTKLLKKEFSLCLHPASLIMLPLAAIVLAPNYPYGIIFFYSTLGLFFICMGGRENQDVLYTMTLPVAKRDVVTARFLMTVTLELAQLLLVLGFVLLRRKLGPVPNGAGLDANLALPGEGLLFFGLYHLVFFPGYYRDVNKVGLNFIRGCVFSGLFVTLEIVASYVIPFVRDVLDTPDPEHRGAKLALVGLGAAVYVLGSLLALRISQRRFEKQDIR